MGRTTMLQKIEAYEIVHFTNKEKEEIVKVLKHYNPIRTEEDSIGRLFFYFQNVTVVFEKNISYKTGKPVIKVLIDSPAPNLVEGISTIELVDEIMVVDETKKEIKKIQVKSKKPLKSFGWSNKISTFFSQHRPPIL
ncbi:protein of unknown function (plasmid) [Thermococcus nautili]|uniref:hypothetical protein n=1 Tax=Thermococcus nautili TaxID=195522 RepID=UPI002553195A|nr:hypothetical protein [Thermococcus nautili]CAI1494260.1 protein of unknown function [Thermococcus nautili]